MKPVDKRCVLGAEVQVKASSAKRSLELRVLTPRGLSCFPLSHLSREREATGENLETRPRPSLMQNTFLLWRER